MLSLVYRNPTAGVFNNEYCKHLAWVWFLSGNPKALFLLRENTEFVEKRREAFIAKHGSGRIVLDEEPE